MSTKTIFNFKKSQTTKFGTYTFAISLIVLTILIFANLLAGAIPKSISMIDTSTTWIYSISNNTIDFLKSVNNKVVINQINPGSGEDLMLSAFLKKYAASSKNISINILDPLDDPNCLDKYSISSSSVSNYSLIIESEKRFTVIDYSELFTFYNSYLAESYGLGEVSYALYQQYIYYFYAAESAGYATEQYFCAEDIITQAIEYVSLDTIPQIYLVKGHGETMLSDTLLSFIKSEDISCEYLDELAEIPSNASCIVINSPTSDISSAEAIAIKKYLNKGGNMLLITSKDNLEMQNLMEVIEAYGVSGLSGIVCDSTGNSTIVPTPNQSHAITAYASSYSMIMPNAHGILIEDTNETAVITSLFTPPANSIIIKNDDSILEFDGTLSLGVAINNGKSNIVWYPSSEAFTDSIAQSSSYGNYYYAFYSLAALYKPYDSSLQTIGGVSMTEPLLKGITSTAIIMWAAIFVIIIPIIFTIIGLTIWIKRRRR